MNGISITSPVSVPGARFTAWRMVGVSWVLIALALFSASPAYSEHRCTGFCGGAITAHCGEMSGHGERSQARFNQLDRDGDGVLSSPEFLEAPWTSAAAMLPPGLQARELVALLHCHRTLDRDGNRGLNLEEFLGAEEPTGGT